MGVASGRWVGAALGLVIIAGCAEAPPPTGLPSFPAPAAAASSGAATGTDYPGVVPPDCTRVITPADVVAVLGLPLNSVAVRATIGVPSPSVGLTERLDCAYSQAPAARPVLGIRAQAYTDETAARDHWAINLRVEDGPHRDVPIGAASGVLVEQPGGALLSVVYGSATLSVRLPDQPLPPGPVPSRRARRPRAPHAARPRQGRSAAYGPAGPARTGRHPGTPVGCARQGGRPGVLRPHRLR